MSQMRACTKLLTVILLSANLASWAADQVWTGRISSTMCNAEKAVMGHDCALNCIRAGAKYVFVTNGMLYQIRNQDFGLLEKYAGGTVKLTGNRNSDSRSITVTQIEPATAPAAK